tara:strand:+ start:1052 stop:1264 length:213 start_codon:yes stop_codon:yes gene_type:complete
MIWTKQRITALIEEVAQRGAEEGWRPKKTAETVLDRLEYFGLSVEPVWMTLSPWLVFGLWIATVIVWIFS